jgi:hypothetical protein
VDVYVAAVVYASIHGWLVPPCSMDAVLTRHCLTRKHRHVACLARLAGKQGHVA